MPNRRVPKVFNLSSMSSEDHEKIVKVLNEKGIPTTYDDHIYRSDSDSYSFGLSVGLDACKKGCNIFVLRSGDDDVYFWLVKSDQEWEGTDDIECEEDD